MVNTQTGFHKHPIPCSTCTSRVFISLRTTQVKRVVSKADFPSVLPNLAQDAPSEAIPHDTLVERERRSQLPSLTPIQSICLAFASSGILLDPAPRQILSAILPLLPAPAPAPRWYVLAAVLFWITAAKWKTPML